MSGHCSCSKYSRKWSSATVWSMQQGSTSNVHFCTIFHDWVSTIKASITRLINKISTANKDRMRKGSNKHTEIAHDSNLATSSACYYPMTRYFSFPQLIAKPRPSNSQSQCNAYQVHILHRNRLTPRMLHDLLDTESLLHIAI